MSSSGNAGRWNPNGTRIIYAGSSPSIALLEYLCIKGPAVSERPWYMVVFEINIEKAMIGSLQPSNLPPDWNALPHAKSTQEFGKMWLTEKEYPLLRVPSARLDLSFYPIEFNLLINPDFRDIHQHLQLVETLPFEYNLNPQA